MSVKIKAPIGEKELYTETEVAALVTSADTAASATQWEKHTLPHTNGTGVGWDLSTFFVNKHTGAVTGLLGTNTWNNCTSLTIGTNANLGTHADMDIRYCDYMEFGATNSGAPVETYASYVKQHNITVNTAGAFTLQGSGATLENVKAYLESAIWNFYYIGSKYGRILTTEPKPIYLPEGTFYDKDSLDLLTGKAWYKYRINGPTGYTAESYVTLYKNFWSGEVILQYSLRLPDGADTYHPPNIAIPTRFNMYGNKWVYQAPRYFDTTAGVYVPSERCKNCMVVDNGLIRFTHVTLPVRWLTGSNYYIGNVETLPNCGDEIATKIWIPESSEAVPTANSSVLATFKTTTGWRDVDLGDWFDGVNYTYRCGTNTSYTQSYPRSFVTRSKTGMIFTYFDFNVVANKTANPITNRGFGGYWLPTVRYSYTGADAVTVFYLAPTYIQYCNNTVLTGNNYGANMDFIVGNSANADGFLRWGSTGQVDMTKTGLICACGHFLGNTT